MYNTKRGKRKMKKMIGMVCGLVMALTINSFGACGEPVEQSPCGEPVKSCQLWWNGTARGKISTANKQDGTYKTVKTLKVTSVTLVIDEENGPVVEVVGKKVDTKTSFQKTLKASVFEWNVFGKNLNKVSSKAKDLESEIWFEAADEEGTVKVSGVLFGKVKAKETGATACAAGCAEYVPGNFSGWFIGQAAPTDCGCWSQLTAQYSTDCADGCLTFVESEEAVEMFGGTINLKYSTKKSGNKVR